jgi:pimeloyl-ACP methyl ester carboxylesterase
MPSFREERLTVNGIGTAVLTAGRGYPLVLFHGAGTVTGFDSLLPLAERYRLVVPIHPGYGDSADDPSIDDVHDYVRHYLDLLDQLGIDELALVGHSMGGYLAATFAVYQAKRISRLVLVSPLGLRVPEHPTADIFTIPDEELLGRLSANLSVFDGKVPMPPTPEFLAARYRESTSTARLLWNRNYDPKLSKWLHRLTMPTLILWGDRDQLIPVEQAATWAELIPGAKTAILPGVGHLVFDESPAAVEAVGAFVEEGLDARTVAT